MKESDIDQAKGRVKQAAGDLTDNDDMRRDGKRDETAGKAKGVVDKASDKLGDAIDSAKRKLDN